MVVTNLQVLGCVNLLVDVLFGFDIDGQEGGLELSPLINAASSHKEGVINYHLVARVRNVMCWGGLG